MSTKLEAWLESQKTDEIITADDFDEAIAVIEKLKEALEDCQIGHVHNETNDDYRPLGDSYGYCSLCHTKVGLNEDDVRDALAIDPEKL